jgi:predicted ATP-dependent serine protease
MDIVKYVARQVRKKTLGELPDIQGTFTKFWDKVGDTVTPIAQRRAPVKLTGLDWFDQMVGMKNGTGMPFGNWILISGPVGSGKTTIGLCILDAFGTHSDVETHYYDSENGPEQIQDIFLDLGINPDQYQWEPNGVGLLDSIDQRAAELEIQGKSLVVLIDSFKLLGFNNAEMMENALKIKGFRNTRKNLLIITINHLTKGKLIEGPANVGQLCDVWITVSRRGDFRYLATGTKNRFAMPNAPDMVKLSKSQTGKPFISKEPDFISDNTIVRVLRNISWPTVLKRKK